MHQDDNAPRFARGQGHQPTTHTEDARELADRLRRQVDPFAGFELVGEVKAGPTRRLVISRRVNQIAVGIKGPRGFLPGVTTLLYPDEVRKLGAVVADALSQLADVAAEASSASGGLE